MISKIAVRELEQVDWNFSDYSSSQYPADINSLHWYPAAFVPQIPAILIKCLSQEGDLVLDPFLGSGTTAIEASRVGRHFVGIDRNPFAINICQAKLTAIGETDNEWFEEELSAVGKLDPIRNSGDYCTTVGIDEEIFKWFELRTLEEILTIHSNIIKRRGTHANLLRQVMLSSILNRCCSQRDHYTYITDRCFPKEMIYRPAREMYCEQVQLTCRAIFETARQYVRVHNKCWIPLNDGIVSCRDARQMQWLHDSTVDLVVTSPPYLGVNDYVRSMRLTAMLFPEEGGNEAISAEIGARRKRHRKTALEEYRQEMSEVFSEISRVLKRTGYLALVIGQGKGRVNKEDIIEMLISILRDEYKFEVHFQQERRIKFRRIQVPGVGTERIMVLRR